MLRHQPQPVRLAAPAVALAAAYATGAAVAAAITQASNIDLSPERTFALIGATAMLHPMLARWAALVMARSERPRTVISEPMTAAALALVAAAAAASLVAASLLPEHGIASTSWIAALFMLTAILVIPTTALSFPATEPRPGSPNTDGKD